MKPVWCDGKYPLKSLSALVEAPAYASAEEFFLLMGQELSSGDQSSAPLGSQLVPSPSTL